MKKVLVLFSFCFPLLAGAQELYVYTQPASNMPARSLAINITDHFSKDWYYSGIRHRLMGELMLGASKKLMLHAGTTFSNMHTSHFRYESVNMYAKYRFLSKDEVHSHFRMAVFTSASITEAPFHFDEVSLMGDKSGIELGVIATALKNKTAVSLTLAHTQVLDKSRGSKIIYVPERLYQCVDYSLSAGQLILPRSYNNYRQVNLNLYAELMGQHSLDARRYYTDLGLAAQLIFNSNTKLNFGHRFQLAGNMSRSANNSWQVAVERTFLNVMKGK